MIAALQMIAADQNISAAFRCALVQSYAACEHGAIGHCALCELCPSCGAGYHSTASAHMPHSPGRDRDGRFRCEYCLMDAVQFDPEENDER